MKKKLLIIPVIIITLLIFTFLCGISIERGENVENHSINILETEIEPEEEIPDLANYELKLTLFFEDKKSGVLTKEERIVNAKSQLDNPYMATLNELLKGPENSELLNPIPEGTKINTAILDKGTLIVDVSSQFLESSGTNAIYSIVNTMSEYNEVENVKITIEGKEQEELKEKFVKVN